MSMLRIAALQMDSRGADIERNALAIAAAAERAHAHGADVLLTPEMALTGYAIEDLLGDEAFLRDAEHAFDDLALELDRVAPGMTVLLGAPVLEDRMAGLRTLPPDGRRLDSSDRLVHNALLVIRDGTVITARSKALLPTYAVFDDARWVVSGADHAAIDVAGVPIGLAICEDLWTSEVAYAAAANGARVLLVANASPFEADKMLRRRDLVAATAQRIGLPVVYANSVGGQDDLVFDGGSLAVDADGCVAAALPLFEPGLMVVDVDPSLGTARWSDDARNLGWQPPRPTRHEQTWRALIAAMRSYSGATGLRDMIIGLSGGLDSAVVAAIAVDALGPDAVLGVGMPGPYSSAGSVDDAKALAANLGIAFVELPIAGTVAAEHAILGGLLEGPGAAVARENIQARLRALHLMTLANARGAMVLNTGNKSEAAVGYFTLGGDASGGFALLTDVYKTEVLALARWRNCRADLFGGGVPPIPQATIDKPPSAELAPGQEDTDSLPPYPVLDAILKAYLEGVRSARDIAAMLYAHHGYSQGESDALALRVLGMVDRAEHKRRQVAPGPRVGAKAFGRDRRMPVAMRRVHHAD